MIWSVMIFALSVATLLMFFVSYCRSLTASSSRHLLSREVRDVTGIAAVPSGKDFIRVTQLLQLCPERPEDRTGLQAVGIYFRLLNVVQESLARIIPSLRAWTEHELAGCTSFAVVVLDRRIAFSREILAKQGEI
jgi:hypothetical protein